jgi:hypothetical protein
MPLEYRKREAEMRSKSLYAFGKNREQDSSISVVDPDVLIS